MDLHLFERKLSKMSVASLIGLHQCMPTHPYAITFIKHRQPIFNYYNNFHNNNFYHHSEHCTQCYVAKSISKIYTCKRTMQKIYVIKHKYYYRYDKNEKKRCPSMGPLFHYCEHYFNFSQVNSHIIYINTLSHYCRY